jgi:hypothetical protein
MLNRCFEGDGFLLPNRITKDERSVATGDAMKT